jgi:hypothetical protein
VSERTVLFRFSCRPLVQRFSMSAPPKSACEERLSPFTFAPRSTFARFSTFASACTRHFLGMPLSIRRMANFGHPRCWLCSRNPRAFYCRRLRVKQTQGSHLLAR